MSSPLDSGNFGIGFDPLICTANHSCDPNAVLAFNQPRTELRALKPIKAGEEIYIKYVDVTNPFPVRQAELKGTYLFTCQCAVCKKGATREVDQYLEPPENLATENEKAADDLVKRHKARLSRFLAPGLDGEPQRRVAAIQAEAYAVLENEKADIDDVKEAIQICIGSKMWPWTRQPVPRLCERLFSLYLQSGSFYHAFRVGVKLHFDILPHLYPQDFYPDRLTNAWVLSTLINGLCGPAHKELYQELAEGGLDLRLVYFGFLFYVHDHTPKMFGPGTPFGNVIENTYKQIMAGINLPEAEMRENLKAVWISLKAVANNVDITSL